MITKLKYLQDQHNIDLDGKVAKSQNLEEGAKESPIIKKSLNNVTFISNYNKKTMSNLHNTNSAETDMENLKALRASIINNEKKNSSEEIVYKIENFFIDDDPFGITLKKDLKQVIEETNDRGFEGLVLLFKYAFQRRRFQLSTPLKDKEGKLYYWAIIKEGMCDIGFKIPIFPGIDRILKSREKVAIYITMEEILEKLKQ